MRVEQLEGRDTPATLDVGAGGELSFLGSDGPNTVTQSFSGTSLVFNDASDLITVTPAAYAKGWRGGGTHTVAGPRAGLVSAAVDLGLGANVFNLRQTGVPETVTAAGPLTTNVSSNAPTNTGTLDGILAPVSVDTGVINLSDAGATTGNDGVVIDATGVYNLGPAPIYTTGPLTALNVTGSNSVGLAEGYTVGGSAGPLTLKTQAGNDTVMVVSDTYGTAYLGFGDDTFAVQAGATWYGDVHTGPGADTVLYGPPDNGDITGTVGA